MPLDHTVPFDLKFLDIPTLYEHRIGRRLVSVMGYSFNLDRALVDLGRPTEVNMVSGVCIEVLPGALCAILVSCIVVQSSRTEHRMIIFIVIVGHVVVAIDGELWIRGSWQW